MRKIKNFLQPAWVTTIFFICLILVEYIFFQQYVQAKIIDYYPGLFDQASYLPNFYHMYENIRHYGWIAGFSQSQTLATGMLFPYQTGVVFL